MSTLSLHIRSISTYAYLVACLGNALLSRTTCGILLADAALAHFTMSLPLHDGRVEVEATHVEDGVGGGYLLRAVFLMHVRLEAVEREGGGAGGRERAIQREW